MYITLFVIHDLFADILTCLNVCYGYCDRLGAPAVVGFFILFLSFISFLSLHFIYIAYLSSGIFTGRLVGGGGGGYARLLMRQLVSGSDRMQNDDNTCCTL